MTFAHWVRLAIFLEVCAIGGFAWWLAEAYEMHAALGAALGWAITLGLRAVVVLLSNGIAAMFDKARPSLALWAWLRMVGQEWLCMVIDGYYRLPFEDHVYRDEAATHATPGTPVVLVHGYFCNRGMLAPVYQLLRAARVGPVFSFSYPAVSSGIEEVVPHLRATIDRALATTGATQVRIVGHSMGGLVSLAACAAGEGPRIERIVALASPFHGTALARLGVGRNGRLMQRGSPLLARLVGCVVAAQPEVPVTAIYTAHDNLVAPASSSELPGFPSVRVAGVNHIAILDDPPVQHALLDALTK